MASYPHTTKAIVSSAPKDGKLNWALQEVKLREPAADELLVRIVASGVCHTDIAMSMIPPEATSYPKITGHEGAGIVEKVGSQVSHVKTGDYVLLSFDFCGESTCYNCAARTPGYCAQFAVKNIIGEAGTYEIPGGGSAAGAFFGQSSFSALALVKERSAVNVSGLVSSVDELKLFAPFGCGFQTGAGAVTETAGVGERDAVAVFGLGGVGMAAVLAAKIRGAKTIIGVDRVQSRLDLAKSLGATHSINTANFEDLATDLATAIREVLPAGTNFNIDTTGIHDILKAGIHSLHPRGELIIIGITQGELPVDVGDILSAGKAIRGCIEGNAQPDKYVPQLIQWYREGKFPIEKLIKHYPINDFPNALGDMHSGATIKPILIW